MQKNYSQKATQKQPMAHKVMACLEIARRNISFLRLRAGAAGEELGEYLLKPFTTILLLPALELPWPQLAQAVRLGERHMAKSMRRVATSHP